MGTLYEHLFIYTTSLNSS